MPILEVDCVRKSFGGLTAVNDVSCAVPEGKIFGLIGPNGSGKTTLFNLITGFMKPNSGKVRFDGEDITGVQAQRICKAGIARTFQLSKPFGTMTVFDNIVVGRLYGNEPARSLKRARSESEEYMLLTGLENKRRVTAGTLGLVDRRKLEVARALATRPKMLFLDEMMAGLNHREIEDAMVLLRNLKNAGMTMMVVEHIMKALLAVSDHVMVLCTGRKIAEGTPKEIVCNEQVIEAYLGEDHDA
ncbi:MAG: ABC transporter ATP-binding protein [Spirochaetes bacterium]|nr:ABC transporter ATP-binding protein [Spirochaetota bacterium]